MSAREADAIGVLILFLLVVAACGAMLILDPETAREALCR